MLRQSSCIAAKAQILPKTICRLRSALNTTTAVSRWIFGGRPTSKACLRSASAPEHTASSVPGGSALNAGQVGSLRAAQYICRYPKAADTDRFEKAYADEKAVLQKTLQDVLKNEDTADARIAEARRRMSDSAAAIRDPKELMAVLEQTEHALSACSQEFGITDKSDFVKYQNYIDTLLTQRVMINAFLDYAKTVAGTRGSALYYAPDGALREGLSEMFRLKAEHQAAKDKIQTVTQKDGKLHARGGRFVRFRSLTAFLKMFGVPSAKTETSIKESIMKEIYIDIMERAFLAYDKELHFRLYRRCQKERP